MVLVTSHHCVETIMKRGNARDLGREAARLYRERGITTYLRNNHRGDRVSAAAHREFLDALCSAL